MILFLMILLPSDFPESTGRDSQNHEVQNHGETVNGWASDNHKVRRTLDDFECETHVADRGHERSRVSEVRHEAASEPQVCP